jgi:CheY-like chemotaxis protein
MTYGRPRVIIAHSESGLREPAMAVARAAGYETIGVGDGHSVRLLLYGKPEPLALVVDVALPGALGLELCDEILTRELPTRSIMVAAVYSKTAYKRRPTQLYGAFDYIEQHHIADRLVDKLGRAVAVAAPGTPPVAVRSDPPLIELALLRKAGARRLEFDPVSEEDTVVSARRLARLVVADIALYAGDLIEEWVANGTDTGTLPKQLVADMAEGQRLFDSWVPMEIGRQRDYLGEALRRLGGTRRGLFGETLPG